MAVFVWQATAAPNGDGLVVVGWSPTTQACHAARLHSCWTCASSPREEEEERETDRERERERGGVQLPPRSTRKVAEQSQSRASVQPNTVLPKPGSSNTRRMWRAPVAQCVCCLERSTLSSERERENPARGSGGWPAAPQGNREREIERESSPQLVQRTEPTLCCGRAERERERDPVVGWQTESKRRASPDYSRDGEAPDHGACGKLCSNQSREQSKAPPSLSLPPHWRPCIRARAARRVWGCGDEEERESLQPQGERERERIVPRCDTLSQRTPWLIPTTKAV